MSDERHITDADAQAIADALRPKPSASETMNLAIRGQQGKTRAAQRSKALADKLFDPSRVRKLSDDDDPGDSPVLQKARGAAARREAGDD